MQARMPAWRSGRLPEQAAVVDAVEARSQTRASSSVFLEAFSLLLGQAR